MEDEENFFNWLNRAKRNNLGDKAAHAYYDDKLEKLSSFTVSYGGCRTEIPGILTHKNWYNYEGELSALHEHKKQKLPEKHDKETLSRIKRLLQYQLDKEQETMKKGENFWNGETTAVVDIADNPPFIKTAESDYYSKVSSTGKLFFETYDYLYDNKVPMMTDKNELNQCITSNNFPFRDKHAGTESHLLTNRKPIYPSLGISCIPIIKQGTNYKMVIVKRSNKVNVRPGKYAGIGGGVEPNFEKTLSEELIREILEELAGMPEGIQPRQNKLGKQLLYSEDVDIEYGNLIIDAIRTKYHIRTNCFIDDPVISQQLIQKENLNFESSELHLVELTDLNKIQELIENFAYTDIITLFGVLEWCREKHDIETVDTELKLTQ